MTNGWADLQNAKVFLIEGSNCAENHVMAMKWIRKAQEKGAKIIHVDPRFNRTSSAADVYARIRPGADIAFLSAVINHVLSEKLYDEEYVKLHTNALLLADDAFGFDEGVFSGYDHEKHKYDQASWGYQLDPKTRKPRKAASLDDPKSVFARLKQHFSRYTPQVAEEISGVPARQVVEIAETFAKNRPGTILYALGMTQHTVGIQNIRCYGILQMLLGNIGVAGGGVNALRGEPNVQGACDMSVLNGYMFGYLNYPNHDQPTLKDWTRDNGTFRQKMAVNGLKAWFGDAATADDEFGYRLLPKKSGKKDYSVYGMVDAAWAGSLKLLWVNGQNPMVTNPNLNYVAEALGKLDMLVVQELWETETAAFWQRPGTDPAKVQTEVLLLPAAYFMEKEGTITGSGRMVQWRYAAVKPPGQAKTDIEIIDEVFRRVRKLYEGSADPKDAPLHKAAWSYAQASLSEDVLKEIGGRVHREVTLPDGKVLKPGDHVAGIGQLQADGSTSSGAWIYAGCFGGGKNLTKRRDGSDKSGIGFYKDFAWTWPGNMKILYNRASCDASGSPYIASRKLIWWNGQKWIGNDVPDFKADSPPSERMDPFIMNAEGVARLWAPAMADGPFPEHYEPFDTPLAQNPFGKVLNDPAARVFPNDANAFGKPDEFPCVATTYRLTEHFHFWTKHARIPAILQPEAFVEVSEGLARKKGFKSGDLVTVRSKRGAIKAKAVVTRRLPTLQIDGKEVHVVGIPIHWGFTGLTKKGYLANTLTPPVGDANIQTPEYKAFLVNVEKA